ncbi:MAG: hypothetical protein K2N89_15105 [Lachnospiraceae bacterium]|nr:hypothetical protein [Lachnospiraceae bacterium]
MEQYDTVMESWFPLGGHGNIQTLFNDETIVSIVEKHGKTSAQVNLFYIDTVKKYPDDHMNKIVIAKQEYKEIRGIGAELFCLAPED